MISRWAVLHPGAMGAALAACLSNNGHEVRWLAAGRSGATAARADAAGLVPCTDLGTLLRDVECVVAVCPPHAAADVAQTIADAGFSGYYLDANAVAPASAAAIASVVTRHGATYIDGGIIGPPPLKKGSTRLYLSGKDAATIVDGFDGSLLEARALDEGQTTASALKMCYAAWTKGLSALRFEVAGMAAALGVDDALRAEWALSQPDLADSLARSAARDGPKAWRFRGEMDEIAATCQATGFPDGFHNSAAAVFGALAELKGRDAVTVDEITRALVSAFALPDKDD